jgi:hypothetical protein
MVTNESAFLDQLPDAEAVRERLCVLTAERNLLKSLLAVFERQGWQKNQRQRKHGGQQVRTAAS